MNEPRWLDVRVIKDIHSEQIARFGGPDGVRDEGQLEAALDRARNKFAYGVSDLASLAAAYAFDLARNHAFVDGNKRIAFHAMATFLRLNRVMFRPEPAHATVMMLALAAGEVGGEGLSRWIRDNWPQS